METGRRWPLSGLTRGQVFSFVVTTALLAGGLALAYAPLWVVIVVAVLAGVAMVGAFVRDWRREKRRS